MRQFGEKDVRRRKARAIELQWSERRSSSHFSLCTCSMTVLAPLLTSSSPGCERRREGRRPCCTAASSLHCFVRTHHRTSLCLSDRQELSYIFTSNLIHNMAQCDINNIKPGNANQYFTRHWANTDDRED